MLPCASCGAVASADRVADAFPRQDRNWRHEWVVKIACAQCLSVTEALYTENEPSPQAKALFAGTEVTRLRDHLRRANEDGSLRREVGKLLSDPSRSVLAGVPEVFPDLLPGIGKHLRLRTNLEIYAPRGNRPEWLGPAIPMTQPWGGPISLKRQATAVKGDGPGGVIPSRRVGEQPPLENIYGAILLVGLRVDVIGARGGSLLVEVPDWATAAIGGQRRILVPWGTAQREDDA